MTDLLTLIVTVIYFSAAAGLLLYGMNCYVMIRLFLRRRRGAQQMVRDVYARAEKRIEAGDLPAVTTQIPIFNEMNVTERVIEAACAMHYPAGLHEVQILDDSTDETSGLIDKLVARLTLEGHNVQVVRREQRQGFKAGALRIGMERTKNEYFAVFDADFVPPVDFLLKTVPFFLENEQLGLVQARWGHLNDRESWLTRAQSIGIDGHFMVEQSARSWNGLFMNFNGTAGIWRREAIEAGGGWQWDTLTEDMDLSYRMQLVGWTTVYLPDMVVPAEIPEVVSAFKNQQFRWAKGSIQTAIKLLPTVLRAPVSPFRKLQAFFHMTHYMVHPLMLTMSLLALPVLLTLKLRLGPLLFTVFAVGLLLAMIAPSTLYMVSQRAAYPDWRRRVLFLPMLMVMGVGLAVSNTRAVFEALIGRESGFVRTPKRGDKELKRYRAGLPWSALVEISIGLYCAYSLGVYMYEGMYLVGPFLALYSAGFLFIGLLTIAHHLGLDRLRISRPNRLGRRPALARVNR
jgi:cellulose synthase/poly-beta-1,6-N-acetylglucosamine synthase-like glycosyltransferase